MSGAVPTREVAYRVFANVFGETTYSYAESDDDRAPQYLVTPTGARINRLFVVGVLTETEEVSDGVIRARIVDPTGAFVLYAGQYQPDALAFFERADPPVFVALTGKARTFEPDGSDRVFSSIRPERVNEVDAATRERWVVETARQTLDRTSLMSEALTLDERGEELSTRLSRAGVEPHLAAGIPKALEKYEPTTGYLAAVQEMALDAIRVVTGENESISEIPGAPGEETSAEASGAFTDIFLESPSAAPDEVEATDEDDSGDKSVEKVTEETPTGSAGTEVDIEMSESTEVAEEESRASIGTDEFDEHEQTEVSDDSDERYELSDVERAEVEENYDVGFESGAEIGSPEETEDIEPEAGAIEQAESDETGSEPNDDETESPADEPETEATETDEPERAETDEPELAETDEPERAETDEPERAETDDFETSEFTVDERQDLVVDTLTELGDGDGVPRSKLVETVQNRHDLSEDEIEEAIQGALLGGRCFESGSEDLKPI